MENDVILFFTARIALVLRMYLRCYARQVVCVCVGAWVREREAKRTIIAPNANQNLNQNKTVHVI